MIKSIKRQLSEFPSKYFEEKVETVNMNVGLSFSFALVKKWYKLVKL